MAENNYLLINKWLFIAMLIIAVIISLGIFGLLPLQLITYRCSDVMICGTLDAKPILLVFALVFLFFELYLIAKKIQIHSRALKITLILFIALAFLVFISPVVNSVRCKSKNAKVVGDLKQISTAQQLFFSENGYYANTHARLANLIGQVPVNPWTGQEYTDQDGVGWEGGDNDPQTWYIQAFVHEPTYRYCFKKSDGYYAYCSQIGCTLFPNNN